MRNRLKISTQRSKSRDGPAEETPKEEPSKEDAPVGDLPKEEPSKEETPKEDSPNGESLGEAAAVTTAAQQKRKSKKKILWFFIKLASVCLVIWIIFTFVFGIGIMKGESMYPRLRDGDLYLYYRLDKTCVVGDAVVYRQDVWHKVARVVAMGGDVVELGENGELIVNGNVQEEEIFYITEPNTGSEIEFPYTVPEDSYFVLADYRTISIDSRTYGAISKDDIEGKIFTFLRIRGI